MEEEKKPLDGGENNEVSQDTAQSGGLTAAVKPKNKVDAFFGITASGSNFKTEIIAGITTFMAMAYILFVNSNIFTDVNADGVPIIADLSFGAIYIATALGAVAGTLLMAFIAKMPLAQAPGMGVNAFLVYTLLQFNTGLTYANCMLFTLIEGLIFVILTVTGLREKIFDAIPTVVRNAIPAGLGFFIAFIGLQGADIIVADPSNLVAFKAFNVLDKGFTYFGIVAPVVAIAGTLAVAVMSKKNVKGAILWGIFGSAALYYILMAFGVAAKIDECTAVFTSISFDNPFAAFKDWGTQSAGKVFYEGFNFGAYLGAEGNNAGTLVVLLLTTALSMCIIDMFNTIGTLYGACVNANLLDGEGKPIRMEKMLLCDAVATCVGAAGGTSTVTTFVESSSGVSAGGRTGFTALVTSICFFVAMFLSPVASLIPAAATAPALIWVGVLMMSSITKINWEDIADAAVAFITIIVMLLGYSISKGIGAGMISYVVISVCTGKVKQISVSTWVITVIFLAMFILTN